jgi:NADH:ubiquinone oxidoreductase subunit H
LFSCCLIPCIFFSPFLPIRVEIFSLLGLIMRFIFIWIRVTFCRFRYDSLIRVS